MHAALIIVDESLNRILSGTLKKNETVPTQQLPTPFQGGYQDFLPFTTTEEAIQTKGPARSSIYDDLCYYVQTHHKLLELSTGPRASTLFLYKIMASESVLLIQYLNSVLSSLAWQLSRQNELRVFQSDWIEQRWSDLIAIQRRIGNYVDDVEETILSLQLENSAKSSSSWKDLAADFQWINVKLAKLQGDTRSLIEAFSGLAGIVGNQQALSEARSVSYLNFLGTTFVPLSLIASILSLPSPYTPGASESWKYWAIGIPMVIAVYAACFLLTLTLKKGGRSPLRRKLMSSSRLNVHGRRRGSRQALASNYHLPYLSSCCAVFRRSLSCMVLPKTNRLISRWRKM
jgi:hypothetical protein